MSKRMKMASLGFFVLFVSFLALIPIVVPLTPLKDLPLHTQSRWILNARGHRVKLTCVSWVSHLEPVVAEGLSKQPLDAISKQIGNMGFNCVRFTWPLFLATNDTLANLTVRQSFTNLGLTGALAGLQTHNPDLLGHTLIDAFKEVVRSLGNNNLMVILDNHISQQKWCCDYDDDNGFFGDKYFDPNVWLTGLTRMGTLFKSTPNVIGMSLRNELRGPNENLLDWYRYMQQGAEAVHSANPHVLVILSGTRFDTDLSFLQTQPVNLTFTGKLVFEFHWYAFSDGRAWVDSNPNEACGNIADAVQERGGFLVKGKNGFPLFISEFGADLRGTNVNDNRFLDCFFSFVAALDVDWAWWSVCGSYYYRQGTVDSDEIYGMLNKDWSAPRNASFLKRLSTLQTPLQGPGYYEVEWHKILFHPLTAQCVVRDSNLGPLRLANCSQSEGWNYDPRGRLLLMRTRLCLQADGRGKPAKLGTSCNTPSSIWDTISDSQMHLASTPSNQTRVCLDVNAANNSLIVTEECKCLSDNTTCEASSQWFKLVDSWRRRASGSRGARNLGSTLNTSELKF